MRIKTLASIGCVILVLALFIYTDRELRRDVTPNNLPALFTVNEGESAHDISTRLHEAGIISSPFLFRGYLSWTRQDTDIDLGVYEFATSSSIIDVARILTNTIPKPLIRVTIPEGTTTQGTASVVAKVMPRFDRTLFLSLVAKEKAQGKLFPETYFLLPSLNEQEILELMTKEYEDKRRSLFDELSLSERSSYEKIRGRLTKLEIEESEREAFILTFASILQGEAKKREDMQRIAGVLWKRLELGMRLQVDVAKETYAKKGLPDSPINNPGIDALYAAIVPIYSNNLYYISDDDGTFYYAVTFEAHKKNIQKYLR